MKFLIFPLAAIANSACSVIYDINQDRVAEYCNSLVDTAQRNACLQRNRTSYEEYERERQKLLGGAASK
ncbi:hypothetical protein [Janthinobacterium fluminis]|uniref:Uncharacterized protein n=1 Tax=Janthinobacterium fluminis TaxID=2987524 RepID=A0ABT5JWX3_9BURK|nr:hypothetical protein [Janthinobacterium fluminis]MDC8756981.1 hypothetical protein [Janthinobacterium fluminis]